MDGPNQILYLSISRTLALDIYSKSVGIRNFHARAKHLVQKYGQQRIQRQRNPTLDSIKSIPTKYMYYNQNLRQTTFYNPVQIFQAVNGIVLFPISHGTEYTGYVIPLSDRSFQRRRSQLHQPQQSLYDYHKDC